MMDNDMNTLDTENGGLATPNITKQPEATKSLPLLWHLIFNQTPLDECIALMNGDTK